MISSSENKTFQKIRFGIVGTNFISDHIVKASREETRFELTAVYSRRQDTANDFAHKHQIAHTFTSLDAMLSSGLVDAVYIASPNSLHASQSIRCMEHGKHVLCEKPLASNVLEAMEMVAAARKYKVCLMEAMKPTLTPNFGQVMKNVELVGKIRHYFSSFCQYSSRYDKYKAGVHVNAFDPSLANGATMDIGIYTIYPMIVLFGKPKAIRACGVLLASGVDCQASVLFEYENGMTATVVFSKITDSTLQTEIQGEAGTLVIDKIATIRSLKFIPGRFAPESHLAVENLTVSTENDEYYYEIKEFIDLIMSGEIESEINSHSNSLATLEVIDEIRKQLGVVYPADLA